MPARHLRRDLDLQDTAVPGWRAAVMRAVDVVVAFATLRDADELPARVGAVPVAAPERPPVAAPERPRFVRVAAPERPGRLRAPERPHPHPHPHRRPLGRPARTRRPGAVRPAPQACTTPLLTRRHRTRERSVER
jgi:hypothetical protein